MSARKPATAREVELESKLAFLEHTLDALSEVVLEQGKAVEQLGERLARAESRLQGEGGPAEESDPLLERPPHY